MSKTTIQPEDDVNTTLEEHLKAVVHGLRGAILDAGATVDADPTHPQDLARRFGLDKSLTWKVSKVVQETEPVAAISHLPGPAGLRKFVRALDRAGAARQSLDTLEQAIAEFERMVRIHTTDRATFDLLLSNMSSAADPRRLESQRKLAYQGNSVIWGVQARVRLAAFFVAPSRRRADWVDASFVGGLLDFRRLRADATWPLLRSQHYNDDGSAIENRAQPIDEPMGGDDGPPLLRDFCSKPLPEIRSIPVTNGVQYDICAGPVGNTAAASCLFGSVSRGIGSVYADESNSYGEHVAHLFTPAEWALCDLFVHRDLPLQMPPEIHLYGRLAGGDAYPISGRNRNRLPLTETVHELGHPPMVSTPLIRDYPDIVHRVFERCGWSSDEFGGYRFAMRYPPIPTLAVFRYDLAQRGT